MSEELGKAERNLVDKTVRELMRELKKIGNLKVQYISHKDAVAKREDIIRITVSIAASEFKTRINLEDVQLDWPRIKDALRTFVAALPA